jgi:hypothetical protein
MSNMIQSSTDEDRLSERLTKAHEILMSVWYAAAPEIATRWWQEGEKPDENSKNSSTRQRRRSGSAVILNDLSLRVLNLKITRLSIQTTSAEPSPNISKSRGLRCSSNFRLCKEHPFTQSAIGIGSGIGMMAVVEQRHLTTLLRI